jgi:hypothetical protein
MAEVCSVIIQAHLHEATQLEQACLKFMKSNFKELVTTASFGRLMKEWPQIMLKITVYNADVPVEAAEAAAEAQRDKEGYEEISSGGESSSGASSRTKRKRGDGV